MLGSGPGRTTADPQATALVEAASGFVHDALVYEAFGGLDDLVRRETLGVTGRGRPWLGECAGGTDTSGAPNSPGRFPDGADTLVNAADFSFQAASPGALQPNSGSV